MKDVVAALVLASISLALVSSMTATLELANLTPAGNVLPQRVAVTARAES